jgi:hypothetical protein
MKRPMKNRLLLKSAVLASSAPGDEHGDIQLPSGTKIGAIYALYWVWNTTHPLNGGHLVRLSPFLLKHLILIYSIDFHLLRQNRANYQQYAEIFFF